MRMSKLKGCYALLMKLKDKAEIQVGALGPLHFSEGCYIYIGSAENGIESRVRSHLRGEKKSHWHIDYFLKKAEVSAIYLLEAEERLECSLATKFADRFEVISKFGSSDCNCKGHLFYGDRDELLDTILNNNMKEYNL